MNQAPARKKYVKIGSASPKITKRRASGSPQAKTPWMNDGMPTISAPEAAQPQAAPTIERGPSCSNRTSTQAASERRADEHARDEGVRRHRELYRHERRHD